MYELLLFLLLFLFFQLKLTKHNNNNFTIPTKANSYYLNAKDMLVIGILLTPVEVIKTIV